MTEEQKIKAIKWLLWSCRTVYHPNAAITDTVWVTHPDPMPIHTTLLDALCNALHEMGVDCDKAMELEFDEQKTLEFYERERA